MNAAGLLTFADFEQLPDTPGKRELLDGELIELPPAKRGHMRISQRIYDLLKTVLDDSRVWIETGYRIGDGWLQPDVSVSWPDQKVENDYMMGSPMLAVEVGSRGNTDDELDRKVARYFENGAEQVWVVQPKTVSMTAYSRNRTGEIISIRITGTYEARINEVNRLRISVPDIVVG